MVLQVLFYPHRSLYYSPFSFHLLSFLVKNILSSPPMYYDRYALGVNLIVCVYSTAQAVVEIGRLISPRFAASLNPITYCVSLFLDQASPIHTIHRFFIFLLKHLSTHQFFCSKCAIAKLRPYLYSNFFLQTFNFSITSNVLIHA